MDTQEGAACSLFTQKPDILQSQRSTFPSWMPLQDCQQGVTIMYDYANSKYLHIPQLVTIWFSLACTLTCVLIQNDQMTLNLAHQKTLTFNTQTPSSLCATKEVEKYWLLSVTVQVPIILDVVLWGCVYVMHPCTKFWLQHHIQMGSKFRPVSKQQ